MNKVVKFLGCSILSASLAVTSVLPAFAYEVHSGDSLAKIAKRNGLTVAQIMALNPQISDPGSINVGDIINLGEAATNGNANANSNASGVNMTLSAADKQLLKTIFDAKFYATKYPDIAKAVGNDANKLFAHFITYGIWETRAANANFDVNAYASSYDDLRKAFGTNVMAYYNHYYTRGKVEKRDCTTIEKALAKVGVVKSVSPLVNKATNTKLYDTVIAQRTAVYVHHDDSHGSSAPKTPDAPESPAPENEDTNLYFDDVCKKVLESYENVIVNYCKQKGGIFEEEILPAWLDKKPELTGNGDYMKWESSFMNLVNSFEDDLVAKYGQDCMDDFKDDIKEMEKSVITDDIAELQFVLEDPAEASKYTDLKSFVKVLEKYPNKKKNDFKNEYEKAHEEWQEKYDSQNFSYDNMIGDNFTVIYKYFPTQEKLDQWLAGPEQKYYDLDLYRLAGYPNEDEMDDAIDAWLLENPEPDDDYEQKYKAYTNERGDAILEVLSDLGMYAKELILGYNTSKKK